MVQAHTEGDVLDSLVGDGAVPTENLEDWSIHLEFAFLDQRHYSNGGNRLAYAPKVQQGVGRHRSRLRIGYVSYTESPGVN